MIGKPLIGLVLSLPKFMVFRLALVLVISVLAKRLAGKSVSDMTYRLYCVSSETLNLDSINLFMFFVQKNFLKF